MTPTSETPSDVRVRWEWALPWLGLGLFLTLAVLGDKGLVRQWQLHDEAAVLQGELDRIERETALLERDVRGLKGDPRHIERVARERLHLVRENEILYRFEE